MKSKKIIIGIVALIGVIGFVFGIREIYGFYNPNVIISYRVVEAEDVYLSLPSYAIEPESVFGYAAKYEEQMGAWWEPTNEMEVRLRTEYVKPMHVTSNVSVENGQTIIDYEGYAATYDGQVEEIEESITLDFVVSQNLPKSNSDGTDSNTEFE